MGLTAILRKLLQGNGIVSLLEVLKCSLSKSRGEQCLLLSHSVDIERSSLGMAEHLPDGMFMESLEAIVLSGKVYDTQGRTLAAQLTRVI